MCSLLVEFARTQRRDLGRIYRALPWEHDASHRHIQVGMARPNPCQRIGGEKGVGHGCWGRGVCWAMC